MAPRSPGSDGAFLVGFRDVACFIMVAGLLMLAVTLALQPALKASATVTDALEKVYAFESTRGNEMIGLRLAHKTVHLLDYDPELYARLEEHGLRGDTVEVLSVNGETLQVACNGEVLFQKGGEGALIIGAGYALAGGIMAAAGCALWIFLQRTMRKSGRRGIPAMTLPKTCMILNRRGHFSQIVRKRHERRSSPFRSCARGGFDRRDAASGAAKTSEARIVPPAVSRPGAPASCASSRALFFPEAPAALYEAAVFCYNGCAQRRSFSCLSYKARRRSSAIRLC